MERIEGVLDGIDYHQFYVVAGGDEQLPEGAFKDEISPHTLIVPTGNALCVSTGIAMGMIRLAIELRDAPPQDLDTSEDWQAVSEVSFEADDDTAAVRLLMDASAPPFDAFPLSNGTGWYRARAHATGRSLDFDSVVTEDPRELHLIQLWRSDGFADAHHYRVDNQWADQ